MTKHRLSHSSEYGTWAAMHQRCNNKNNRCYENYGGRGIKVSEEWNSFEQFFADMGPRPHGLTLERIDNNAGYSKENCRWASRKEQTQNRRNMNFFSYNGKTLTPNQWADEIGMSKATIWKRMKKNLPVEQLLAPTNSPLRGINTRRKF